MTYLANSAFFTAGNKNYISGADTALSIDGLTKGEVAFMDQVDGAGKPIGVMPAILLTPTGLSATASQLFKSMELRDTTSNSKYPVSNPHQGKFRVEVSRYLANASYKHWKQRQVGVKVVRELLGVVSSEEAQSGIVVTSGTFTPDAIEFASRNPIRLIEGRELIAMLREVQNSGRIQGTSSPPPPPNPPAPPVAKAGDLKCPKCGAEMVRRVAKSGQHAGSQFLGCSRYPACRGIRNLAISNS